MRSLCIRLIVHSHRTAERREAAMREKSDRFLQIPLVNDDMMCTRSSFDSSFGQSLIVVPCHRSYLSFQLLW